MNKIICVYKIINTETGRIYIGQTVNYKRRLNEHKCDLNHNRHSNSDLQQDYNKYGWNSFKFKILEVCSKSNLLIRETYWINYYGGKDNYCLYNKCDMYGHNKEYKRNQSLAQKGSHKITEEGKLRISKANKGKTISEEQKQKISQSAKLNPNYGMKNKKHSEHSKQLMSFKKKGKYLGSNNPNYKYTPEFIENLKKEYFIVKSYSILSEKYNINVKVVYRLIKYGKC